jgi:hypothetical protein
VAEGLLVLANRYTDLPRLRGVCARVLAIPNVPIPRVRLAGDLKRYVGNPKFSDVTFLIEGQQICAHKVLLTCRSEYFRVMFKGSFAESEQREVTLHDVSTASFLVLLEYLYTDKIHLTPENVVEILQLASEMTLEALQRECEAMIIRGIDHTNCIDLYQMASLYSIHHLRRYCHSYIKRELNNGIRQTPAWQALPPTTQCAFIYH